MEKKLPIDRDVLLMFLWPYFVPTVCSKAICQPCRISINQDDIALLLLVFLDLQQGRFNSQRVLLLGHSEWKKLKKKPTPLKCDFFCMEIDYWTNQWWFVPFLAFGGPLGGPGGPGGFLGGQENPKLSISIWDQIKLWDAGFWAKTTCHTMFLIFQAQSGPLGPKKGKFGPK